MTWSNHYAKGAIAPKDFIRMGDAECIYEVAEAEKCKVFSSLIQSYSIRAGGNVTTEIWHAFDHAGKPHHVVKAKVKKVAKPRQPGRTGKYGKYKKKGTES